MIRRKPAPSWGDGPEKKISTSALLAWLIATGRLDIRIALVANAKTQELYHEKIGVFEDDVGQSVAFSGSANESRAALFGNFEVVEIFRSWEPSESRRVSRKQADFHALWHSETGGLTVYQFAEAVRLGLLRVRTDDEIPADVDVQPRGWREPKIDATGISETLSIPSDIRLRQYQQDAVRQWFKANGRGIFEMATGTGKTIAALAAATKLYEQIGGPLVVVIVCPYLHLVTQWTEEAKEFGLDPVRCAIGRRQWQEELAARLYNATLARRPITSLVATNATMASEAFQTAIRRVDIPVLFVADEVHNLGALQLREMLPPNAKYRLGLSATPERRFDPAGNRQLDEYFGNVIFRYGLKEALADKVLCPYRYEPVPVELCPDEAEEYSILTEQIARALARSEDLDEPTPQLEMLLIKRARLIATARNKLPALAAIFRRHQDSSHNLVYCGDGSVEREQGVQIERQVDAVTRLLGRELGMRVAKYTAETPLGRRDALRRDVANGSVQCLIAIRCLDEGVDIPEIRRAVIIASSTNPRQFVQRRGRLLRRAEGKELAEIFDLFVLPPGHLDGDDRDVAHAERALVGRELARAIEFANLAVNGPEALERLLPIRDHYRLLDLGMGESA